MTFLLSKLLPLLVYPLGLGLSLQLLALILRRRRCCIWLVGAGIVVIALPSMPLLSRQLVWGLEEQSAALSADPLPKADAVLVLGGGLRPALPPRRQVEVNEGGDRMLTGLQLWQSGKAPWLVLSGGKLGFTAGSLQPSEANSALRFVKEQGLATGRVLLLNNPRTTAEEAQAFAVMARARQWRSVLLVTSALHLPRAYPSLQKQVKDVELIPVAADYLLPSRQAYGKPTAASLMLGIMPDAECLNISTQALREHMGLLVYRLRGQA
jgi:uncharacterized SAM-binding protein YcdF (DUF218 family)